MSVLEVVFVGQCEGFVCPDFVIFFFFFFLGCKTHRSASGVSVLYKMSVFPTPTPLIRACQAY